MAKKRAIGRYPKAFRKMAVERLKSCDNIVALSEELGVHRRLLYKWRDQLEPIDDGEAPPENSKERELRLQVAQLKRLVADKTLEAALGYKPPEEFEQVATSATAPQGATMSFFRREEIFRSDVGLNTEGETGQNQFPRPWSR